MQSVQILLKRNLLISNIMVSHKFYISCCVERLEVFLIYSLDRDEVTTSLINDFIFFILNSSISIGFNFILEIKIMKTNICYF
jgi:hypothetical protein